jgi:hypothetical protein
MGSNYHREKGKSVLHSPVRGDITDADFQVPNVGSYDENNHQLVGWGHAATSRVSWHPKSGVEQVELCDLQLMESSEVSMYSIEPSMGLFRKTGIEYFADFNQNFVWLSIQRSQTG